MGAWPGQRPWFWTVATGTMANFVTDRYHPITFLPDYLIGLHTRNPQECRKAQPVRTLSIWQSQPTVSSRVLERKSH